MRLTFPIRVFAFTVLAAALAHAAATAAPAGPASRNLLANPGFEQRLPGSDWMPAAWDTSTAGLETVFFGRDSFLVHGGRFSVNVANTSTLYWMGHNWNQTVLVGREAWGKTAVFSVWTRSNGQQGRAYILAQAYRDTASRMAKVWGVERAEALTRLGFTVLTDPYRDLGWQRIQFEDENTGWVRREARIVVPRGSNVIFVRCGLLGTGQVLFDDASLTLEPAPAPPVAAANTNLLADPGFESGALAWEWAIPPFEGARIERDTTVAHTGRVSMRAERLHDGVVTARAGMCQALRADGLRGKRVRIGGWFKADSLTSPAFVLVSSNSMAEKQQSGTTEQLTGTFDWKYTSTEFDVPEDADILWAWMMLNAPAQGTLWMDDLSLEVIGPSSTARPKAPANRRR